jgi:hypothetical protein
VADASRRASSHCHCEAYWIAFKDEAAIIKKLKNSSRTENRKYIKADDESTTKTASIEKEPDETSIRISRRRNNREGKKNLRGITGLELGTLVCLRPEKASKSRSAQRHSKT